MRRLDRLTDDDVRILRLESGPIRGHTCKVVILDPSPQGRAIELAALRSHLEGRLDRFPRLRRRLAATPLGLANPAWMDDPDFDLTRHVVSHETRAPVDEPGLRAIVGELMAERLERDRPLWRIDLVDPLASGGAALVMRIHHCLADGMTAGRILSQVVLDSAPGAAGGDDADRAPVPGRAEMLALAVRDRAEAAAATVARGLCSVGSPRAWVSAADTVRRLPGTVRRELMPVRGGESPLDVAAGPRRVVAFVSRPLDELRRVSKAFGAGITINDVVLTAIGGGLSAWVERGNAPASRLRAKVPVSLHQAGEDPSLAANRDSFLVVDLALERSDAVERLLAISAETQDRKRHHDAEEIDAVLHDLGHVSRSLERAAERWSMRPSVFAVNVSNVSGPRGDLSLLGTTVMEVHSLAEVANRHALRASAFSAAGRLSFGLCADADAIEDIETVAAGVERTLDELVARAPAA